MSFRDAIRWILLLVKAKLTTKITNYMSLTAQRNLGVPIRHAERRAAGRTYENR